MRKVYLTPFDQQRIDPTGRGREFLRKLKDGKPAPQMRSTTKHNREWWLEEWQALRNKLYVAKHKLAHEWDCKHDVKYGAQGGTFDISYVLQSYEESYALAQRNPDFHYARIGRDYLLRYLSECIQLYGRPQPVQSKKFATSASLPTMLRKGDFIAETYGVHSTWFHPIPMLCGQRYQRLKKRTINQDPVHNVRKIEDVLARVRNYLRYYTPFFPAWLNPETVVQPTIYQHLNGSKPLSIETDFSKCDESFSLEIALEICMPLYELLEPDEFISFASFVEELFYQPIYFGDYMLEGKHNLLSGQCITNDFETIYDVCVVLGVLLETGELSNAKILALGDDIAVLLNRVSSDKAKNILELMYEEFTLNGMQFSREKEFFGGNSVRFLRRLYYAGCGPQEVNANGDIYWKGVYPCVLALNNIVNPERPNETRVDDMVANLQRMDNTYGSFYFTPFVQFVTSHMEGPLFIGNKWELQSQPTDWWSRLYDEIWCAKDSPTLRVMEQSNIPLVI